MSIVTHFGETRVNTTTEGMVGRPALDLPLDALPALKVFLDCTQCDTEYQRQNVTFVDYVRDRALADHGAAERGEGRPEQQREEEEGRDKHAQANLATGIAGLLLVERVVEGEEAVRLDGDLLVIPTPGHTRGHAVLLYGDKYLFTGDHLAWSPTRNSLTAFRSTCWYSWAAQTRSMERLLDYEFEWVLPGHGRIHHDSAEAGS